MFVTNHVLAGTLVGLAFRRHPVLAFAVGVASHVAMDMVPHWGDCTLDDDGFYRVARRDGLLGLGVTACVLAAGPAPRRAVVAGIAGATGLDADKPARYLLGLEVFPGWLQRFHSAIQREAPQRIRDEIGYGSVLSAIVAGALTRARGRPPSTTRRARPG